VPGKGGDRHSSPFFRRECLFMVPADDEVKEVKVFQAAANARIQCGGARNPFRGAKFLEPRQTRVLSAAFAPQ
jgi:hypothetical protein